MAYWPGSGPSSPLKGLDKAKSSKASPKSPVCRATADTTKLNFIVNFAQVREMGRESIKVKILPNRSQAGQERCTREYPR